MLVKIMSIGYHHSTHMEDIGYFMILLTNQLVIIQLKYLLPGSVPFFALLHFESQKFSLFKNAIFHTFLYLKLQKQHTNIHVPTYIPQSKKTIHILDISEDPVKTGTNGSFTWDVY